jgi:hypothetical protein
LEDNNIDKCSDEEEEEVEPTIGRPPRLHQVGAPRVEH